MVDTISLILAILAVIIAIVAIILVFVISGPKGPTGPTGSANTTGFLSVVGNATASMTGPVPTTVTFSVGTPLSVVMKYDNPSLLYNNVYNSNTGIFTLAAGSSGYYSIYTENAISVSLNESVLGNVTIYADLFIGTSSVARSQSRIWFDSGSTNEVAVEMVAISWQGNLVAGNTVYVQITVSSSYNGTLIYNLANLSRIQINGTNSTI